MENINNVDSFAALEGFSLNRIVYFTAVVEAGSFTAAAGRLGITKAVVSQQVARLEADFNIALLIRTTRRVRLTEAGEAFYRRCVRILKEAENAFGRADRIVGQTFRRAAPDGTL
ncbi:Hca operon transcriptional activator [Pluralibacter gergoviae]|nr:Hca operon transcriptional activator [Pluralibacter gergoviae]